VAERRENSTEVREKLAKPLKDLLVRVLEGGLWSGITQDNIKTGRKDRVFPGEYADYDDMSGVIRLVRRMLNEGGQAGLGDMLPGFEVGAGLPNDERLKSLQPFRSNAYWSEFSIAGGPDGLGELKAYMVGVGVGRNRIRVVVGKEDGGVNRALAVTIGKDDDKMEVNARVGAYSMMAGYQRRGVRWELEREGEVGVSPVEELARKLQRGLRSRFGR